MVDPEAARRQAMLPPGVAWNARVAAARRMATEGCQPQHLALEETTSPVRRSVTVDASG